MPAPTPTPPGGSTSGDQPHAEVEIGGQRRRVHARETTPGELARLWPRLVAANPDYAEYRAKAQRPIPVVILEPR